MSSAVVSTSAALGRHFVFEEEAEPQVGLLSTGSPESRVALDRTAGGGCPHINLPASRIQTSKIPPASVAPASRLEIRPAPEMVPSGVAAIDALTGGLPRGCLTEICGPASSGRTSLLLAALAAASRRGEFCAVVDASDALDPHSAAAAGVELDHLLWVRCGEASPGKARAKPKLSQTAFQFGRTESQHAEHRLEQVLRATDLLLESGGFGLIVLDLADLPPQAARRIPLTTWFRFRRAIEHTPTMLVAIEHQPIAGSCSSLLLQLESQSSRYSAIPAGLIPFSSCDPGLTPWANECRHSAVGEENADYCVLNGPQRGVRPSHAQLLTGMEVHAELVHSRIERKPACSVTFETQTAWAG